MLTQDTEKNIKETEQENALRLLERQRTAMSRPKPGLATQPRRRKTKRASKGSEGNSQRIRWARVGFEGESQRPC